MKTVYALLIGINDYREDILLGNVRFEKLEACVNDVKRMNEFLSKDTSINYKPLLLTDKDATKPNIKEAFEKHLAQAGEEDAILIYYSGHGATEQADTNIWTSETDGRLETMVCYYDQPHTPDFLLVDKELRYLLHELYQATKAHIVTIFDCCHSGDNTRSVVTKKIRERRIKHNFPQRQLKEFLFYDKIDVAALHAKPLSEVLPQAPHVQLAASESDEPAVEVDDKGVFTDHLIHTLSQSGGHLSYVDLHSRIRNKMDAIFEQKPKVYAPNASRALLQSGFLDKEVGVPKEGEIVFNTKKNSWVLNRGVLHGVSEEGTKVLVVSPSPANSTGFGEQGSGLASTSLQQAKQGVEGSIRHVELDSALVDFDADSGLDTSVDAYSVKLKGMQQACVKVRLVNQNTPDDEVVVLTDVLDKLVDYGMLAFEDDVEKADFDLVLWNGLAYLTLPDDWLRPLINPEFLDDKEWAETLSKYLQHISGWTLLKDLENKGSNRLSPANLKVEFGFVDAFDEETPKAPDSDNSIPLEMSSADGGKTWGGKLTVTLTNTSNSNLYIAALYMPLDFSIQTALLEPAVSMLEPKKSIVLWEENGGIPIQQDPKCYWYNWEKEDTFIKFIYSTDNFSEELLEKAALPSPDSPALDGFRGKHKGLGLANRRPVLQGWSTKGYKLIFKYPNFDKNNARKLEALIEYDEALKAAGKDSYISHFASGLYLQQQGFGTYTIDAQESEVKTKGFARDTVIATANTWANFWRNRLFKKMAKRLPDTPHLLAEGDSWFQHPLLRDVIDNVGKFYPVYCVSAAGDTIRNYLRGGQFIQQIKDKDPRILLISGGGNDILGESMEGFLVQNPNPEGGPASYFNDSFKAELDTLSEIYRTIFEYYKTNLPGLHIIVHGYDYPWLYEPGTKKMSWISKYLDSRNILEEKHRKATARFLIDEFNKRLQQVTAPYDHVHYLDLRGIVKDGQWHDEIHPDNTGFQNVSLKFIQKISELLR